MGVCYLKISSVKFQSQLREKEMFCCFVYVFLTWSDDDVFLKKKSQNMFQYIIG